MWLTKWVPKFPPNNGVFPKVHLFYAGRQCGALNNPYWNEKGLVASFDLPQQVLTCQRNFDFIFKQTELLFVQSVEVVDKYIEGIVATTWNH